MHSIRRTVATNKKFLILLLFGMTVGYILFMQVEYQTELSKLSYSPALINLIISSWEHTNNNIFLKPDSLEEQTIIISPKHTEEINQRNEKNTTEYYEHGFLKTNEHLCDNENEHIKLLILVVSSVQNFIARESIRKTWGSWKSFENIAMAFFVGRTLNFDVQNSLDEEHELYGDIIQGRNIDSYRNLTLKVISMLEWTQNYCSDAKFVLKVDDDVFVNVPLLVHYVSYANSKRKIYGKIFKREKVIRNVTSKYYVSKDQYALKYYPPFAAGPAYLLTGDVVPSIFNSSLKQKPLQLEDVYLTGITAGKLGIKRVHKSTFRTYGVEKPFNATDVLTAICIHYISLSDKFALFDIVQKYIETILRTS